MPYLIIGAGTEVESNLLNGRFGYSPTLTLTAYSDYEGNAKLMEINEWINLLIKQPMALDGVTYLVRPRCDYSQILPAANGKTRMLVKRLRMPHIR